MQVFKVFFKILSKRIATPIIYISVFLAIAIIMSTQNNDISQYTDKKLDINVVDLDNSNASQSLIDFLSENHDVNKIEYDHDKILDDIYYQTTDYVLVINKDYEKKLEQGETEGLLSNYQIPGSYSSSLAESQIDRYISGVKSYIIGGFTLEESLSKTIDVLQNKTEVVQENFSSNNNKYSKNNNFKYFFQYLAYIFIAILISSLVPILLTLNKKEIKARTNASCLSASKQTLQTGLGAVIYSLVIWLIFMISAMILSSSMFFSKEGMLAVLNSFIFMIVALSLSMFISSLAPSPKATDMIANTISLAMSFLCGVFVPMEFLSKPILNAAHFLPAYWFIRANNMLAGESGEIFKATEFFSFLGMELLFAAALFSLAMVVANVKRKSSSL